jgi:hypothetical protein
MNGQLWKLQRKLESIIEMYWIYFLFLYCRICTELWQVIVYQQYCSFYFDILRTGINNTITAEKVRVNNLYQLLTNIFLVPCVGYTWKKNILYLRRPMSYTRTYEIPLFILLHFLVFLSVSRKPHRVFYNRNKKFWEELIPYFFFSIPHGPHRKRRPQQFFTAVGTCWPSHYLATMWGYTAKPTDSLLWY